MHSTISQAASIDTPDGEGQPLASEWRVPACFALAAFWLSLWLLVRWTTAHTQGQFTYGLDDAYIHLAIARNFALHGVWGINSGEFASATSSPIWTLILSGLYRPFLTDLTPFVLNVILGSIAIIQASFILRRYRLGIAVNTIVLLLFVFSVSLPNLAMSGMEHVLQVVIVVAFLDIFGTIDAVDGRPSAGLVVTLFVLSLLLPVVRYESLLMLFAASAWFALTRRWAAAAGTLFFALLGTLAFGIFFVSHGGWLLPNSVLVKAGNRVIMGTGIVAVAKSLLTTAAMRMAYEPFLITLLFVAGYLIAARRSSTGGARSRGDYDRSIAVLFMIACAGQLLFVSDVMSVRYQAYIVAPGLIWVLPMAFRKLDELRRLGIDDSRRSMQGRLIVFAAASVLFLVARVGECNRTAMYGPVNIHDQQVQIAKFVRRNYYGRTIAVNDIGAVTYFGGVRTLDLAGLANSEAARYRMAGSYGVDQLDHLSRENSAVVAAIYEDWFDAVPSTWRKVGSLRIEHNVICAYDHVTFYAVSPDDAPRLSAQLRRFGAELPPGDSLQLTTPPPSQSTTTAGSAPRKP